MEEIQRYEEKASKREMIDVFKEKYQVTIDEHKWLGVLTEEQLFVKLRQRQMRKVEAAAALSL